MEHYSSTEGTPKEGYLTLKSATEAKLVMELKYNVPFVVYRCKVCQKWHIGRSKGGKRMDENEKKQLDQYRRNVENPPYPGIRTKKELKNAVVINNTEKVVKEGIKEGK